MDNIFCIFTPGEDLNKILINNSEIIFALKKKFGNFTVVSFSKILKINKTEKPIKILFEKFEKADVRFFNPNSKSEFQSFINNKKIFAIDALGINYTYVWNIRRLINKKNIFLILLLDSGFISNENVDYKTSFKGKSYEIIRYFLKKIYRLLVLLKFFPPIFIYFECRKDIFEHFAKNKKFHFFEKIFPFLNIFNIKNIFYINSKSSKNLKLEEKLVSEDLIIFIDGNFQNKEFSFRDNINFEEIKNDYFKNLSKILIQLKEVFKKKVEICLHPSSDEKVYKEYFERLDIFISKGETKEKILKSSVVLFHESSAIIDAIFLKKKIISLSTHLFGKYHSNRVDLYKNELDLFSIDIHKDLNFSKNDFDKKFNTIDKNYNTFLEKINMDNEDSSEKVVRILESFTNR
jgi:hypothetical protein